MMLHLRVLGDAGFALLMLKNVCVKDSRTNGDHDAAKWPIRCSFTTANECNASRGRPAAALTSGASFRLKREQIVAMKVSMVTLACTQSPSLRAHFEGA